MLIGMQRRPSSAALWLIALPVVAVLHCGGRVASVNGDTGDAGVDAFGGSTSSSSGGSGASSSGAPVGGSSSSGGGSSSSGGETGNGSSSSSGGSSGGSGDGGSVDADAEVDGDAESGATFYDVPHCLVSGGSACCQACQQADPAGFMSLVVNVADCLCNGGPCGPSCSSPADFCHVPGQITTAQCQNCVEAFTIPSSQCPAFTRTVAMECQVEQDCPQYAACAKKCP
jgi:hypothetical protein